MIGNDEIARVLHRTARALERARVQHKPRAYERAAQEIETWGSPVAQILETQGTAGLLKIPGVGKSIAGAIEEIVRTGRLATLDRLLEQHPEDLEALARIRGVGRRRADVLAAAGILTIDALEEAAKSGRLAQLRFFGPQAQARVARSLEWIRGGGGGVLRSRAAPLAQRIEARLRSVPGVADALVVGDLRRATHTVSEIRVLVAARDAAAIDALLGFPDVEDTLERGPSHARVRLGLGLPLRLDVVDPARLGAAIVESTGSAAHVARLVDGAGRLEGATEEAVYAALGLPWIPPELREDAGEIEAARAGRLPDLVRPEDLRGDLQIQTTWTDGDDSIEAMVVAAVRLGRAYVAITDHTRDLAMTGGSDEAALERQAEEIREVQSRHPEIRILRGAEVNIREDGTLDIDDAALAKLDFVGAAVHSHFDLPRDVMTARVVRAIENRNVDALFHPTCRRLGIRAPIEIDLDRVYETARRTGVALEVDAQPDRLDLGDVQVRAAVDAGVSIVIDSDAHRVRELGYPEAHGIPVARRGWVTRASVLNARPVDEFLEAIRERRHAR